MTTSSDAYCLILTFHLAKDMHGFATQFIMRHFVPEVQTLRLRLISAYHTAWGNHPNRQMTFFAEDWDIMKTAITSQRFTNVEKTLLDYVEQYSRKVVIHRNGFQF